MVRSGRFLTVLLILVLLVPVQAESAGTPVAIPDNALEDAIRRTLREWDRELTANDLAKLTLLEAQNAGISDLRGLEHAVNLKKLDLSDNQVAVLDPLKALTKLEHLNLKWNRITNVTALKNLHKLVYLGLENNEIEDIAPLAGLSGLKRLNLGKNRIRDLSPLSRITGLEQIILYFNGISNISFLSDLTNLQVANLSDNKITSIRPLVMNLEKGGLSGAFINLAHNMLDTSAGSPAMKDLRKLTSAGVDVNYGSQIGRKSPPPLPEAAVDTPRNARGAVRGEVQLAPESPEAEPMRDNLLLTQLLMVFGAALLVAIMYVVYKLFQLLGKREKMLG